jgi:hypothetical protein
MLLAEFIAYRLALLVYWSNILLLGAILYASWGYAIRPRLVKDDLPADVPAAVCRRIVNAQSLYALGALLCVINPIGASDSFFSCNSITRWLHAFAGALRVNLPPDRGLIHFLSPKSPGAFFSPDSPDLRKGAECEPRLTSVWAGE